MLSSAHDTPLTPAHCARYIAGSAIAARVAEERGYASLITPDDWRGLAVPHPPGTTGLYIPSYDIEGRNDYYQVRYDTPLVIDGEERKYGTPKGMSPRLDVLPHIRAQVGDPTTDLWIVEGVRKADAGISAGYCCVGMAGANMGYRATDEGPVLREDFAHIPLDGRRVYICLDSDCWYNADLYKTFRTFCRLLTRKGARVYQARLAPLATGAKVGLDDYLAAGGDMRLLQRAAVRFRARYARNDTGNAQRFVDRFYPEVRYVSGIGWYIWTPETGCWQYAPNEESGPPARLVRMWQKVVARMTDEMEGEEEKEQIEIVKWQHRCGNGGVVSEMVKMARTDARIEARLDDFDTHAEYINCANGVLDLRTLTLVKPSPLYRFTQCVPVAFVPTAEDATLDTFLSDLFPDPETRAAVLRAFGTALVGDNRLHKFFLIHGPGGSGKGTLLDLVSAVLGEYAASTAAETWLRNNPRKENRLEELKHARFVHSEELSKGARIDEAHIKNATGGDLVQARKLYHPAFTYRPRWTLFINTNERPRMDVNDSGLRRRYFEIPVPRAIPAGQMDAELRQRLTQNTRVREAFFRLMAEGARDFLTTGLRPTEAMLTATAQAWQEQEPLHEFLRDECSIGPDRFVSVEALKTRYTDWCKAARTRPLSSQKFNSDLARLAQATRTRQGGVRGWAGLSLTDDNDDNFSGVSGNSSREENPLEKTSENDRKVVKPVTPTDAYEYITDPARARAVLAALEAVRALPLDIETTGLNPRRDRVRLVSVHDGERAYLFDLFALAALREEIVRTLLEGREIIGHNLLFEFGFLPPGKETTAWDTMLATQVLDAGLPTPKGHFRLDTITERFIGTTITKTEQASDWSGDLTEAQRAYAAADVAHLTAIRAAQEAALGAAGLGETAELEMRALMGISWMARTGAPFDLDAWRAYGSTLVTDVQVVQQQLAAIAPINWNSPAQVREYFAGCGLDLVNTDESTLAALDHPVAGLLHQYRGLAKAVGAAGEQWATYVTDARIHAGWKQNFTATGRMSCAEPNLQNLPRDPQVRRCFRAGEGRVLIKADYGQIEARIVAQMSGDTRLRAVFQSGADVYEAVARDLLRKETITPAERQIAKSAVLGLMYGMGNERFTAYARTSGVTLDDADLQLVRYSFFQTYKGIRDWQRQQGDESVTETRTMGGRRRLFAGKNFAERLNAPVQGTAADGLKRALAFLWEGAPDGLLAPVLAIHDEIVVECDEAQAAEATAVLVDCMTVGMARYLPDVPVVVETHVGKSWGGA